MHLVVTPGGPLRGEIRVSADKSISHRAVIFGAIADGTSRIRNLSQGEDVRATVAAFRQMGVAIRQGGEGEWEIDGVGLHGLSQPPDALDFGNSGTALRLVAGLMCGQRWQSTLVGDASLSARPMARIIEPLTQMGARIQAHDAKPPLTISPARRLKGISYRMPVASAQVKSAVLLAGLYAEGVTSVSGPAPTRDHTERMLAGFGGPVYSEEGRVAVRGGGEGERESGLRASEAQIRMPADSLVFALVMPEGKPESSLRASETPIRVPADLSSAAFFLVGASIIRGSDVLLRGVGVNPSRNGVLTILQRMGADIELHERATAGGEPVADIRVRHPGRPLRGCRIDGDDIALAIDEIPAIAVAAACAQGPTEIRDAAELRVKESDRISSVAQGLTALGVKVKEHPDGLTIAGAPATGLKSAQVDSHGDHRIAMAFAIAAATATGAVQIQNTQNIATSFPDFHQVARQTGLDVAEVDGE